MFKLHSPFLPSGDQPQAIEKICKNLNNGIKDQVLLGVTGSGKTFTMANVIAKQQKPALIIAHNKTLAAQIYEEMKYFFPENAVEYFISYYDYYQPEAYIAKTDTFIEKDALINEKIETFRHSATRSLLERKDVIVVSSVSCIYGLGAPDTYMQTSLYVDKSIDFDIDVFSKQLAEIQYSRNNQNLKRGTFRVRGDVFDVHPSHYENNAWRIYSFGKKIEKIVEFSPITGEELKEIDSIKIFPNSHYIIPRLTISQAINEIKKELDLCVKDLQSNNKVLEASRLNQRTKNDIEMISETGTCKGIENYSRYFCGRDPGDPPPNLFEYFPKDSILFIDESHIMLPQLKAMYHGNLIRKQNLVEHGFRLPSAFDNRPLKFEEWEAMKQQTIYISATPGKYEILKSNNIITEQIIRPTGLIDPMCFIMPIKNQMEDIISRCIDVIAKNYRILITVLTKKMAEHLANYMQERNLNTVYLHSEIDSLERVEIIGNFRKGIYDILIGVNLLREGIDIPECGMVAILDADKEGFLRSETSLIQTIGRAARNVDGFVVMYADNITNSIKKAIDETNRRRTIQAKHNEQNNITPRSVQKKIHESIENFKLNKKLKNKKESKQKVLQELEKKMQEAAENLDFELAISIRNKILSIKYESKNICIK